VNNTSANWDASFPSGGLLLPEQRRPAYVERSWDLEPQVLEAFQSIGSPAASGYVEQHVAKVHLFASASPFGNVDFSAY